MSTWHFYDPATGVFSGAGFTGSADDLHALLDYKGGAVGAYCGEVDYLSQRVAGLELELVDHGPPAPAETADETWRWEPSSRRWIAGPTLDAARRDAADAIDTAAGAARLRYITEAPGQQAVYLRKAEESRAFRAASYAGDVPPYVAAEAQAMGMTPQAAAERILAIADAWDNQLSPAIEGMRIGAKNAVALATTVEVVTAARDAALAQLAAV